MPSTFMLQSAVHSCLIAILVWFTLFILKTVYLLKVSLLYTITKHQ